MNGFWKKQLPSALLALVLMLSLTPVSLAAGTARSTVNVTDQDASIRLEREDEMASFGISLKKAINTLFTRETDNNFTEVTFSALSSSRYGRLYTTERQKTEVITDERYTSSEVSDFCFVPSSRDSFSLSYAARDREKNTVSGTITLEILDAAPTGKLTYHVTAGEQVDFDRSDFQDLFEEAYGSENTIRYVTFETDDFLSEEDGTIYYDYDGDDETAFSRKDLDDYTFYYRDPDDGDLSLNRLSFVAPRDAESRTVHISFRAARTSHEYVDGELIIQVEARRTAKDLSYRVDPGKELPFQAEDFNDFFQATYPDDDVRYVTFETEDTLSRQEGTVYYNYGRASEERFTTSSLSDYRFYCNDSDDGDYDLDRLSFVVPEDAKEHTVTLDFCARGSGSRKVYGSMIIKVGKGSKTTADILYTIDPGKIAEFDRADFNDFFQDSYDNTLRYVTFSSGKALNSAGGALYTNYGKAEEKLFTSKNLEDYRFYYSDPSFGDYALNDLSFVSDKTFQAPVVLEFTAWYSETRHVDGVLQIQPSTTPPAQTYESSIRYYTTYQTNVQINPYDIARFFNGVFPDASLSYVELIGVPSTGSLYYNYYGASQYGPKQSKLTAANCGLQRFYFSPSSTSQFALSELTYIPSGMNYCAAIPFVAYGSNGLGVSGTIQMGITYNRISEIYGVSPMNASVPFPAKSFASAVSNATGIVLDSIQLSALPNSSVGTIYVGSNTKADTSSRYTVSSSGTPISSLRFQPAKDYAGSVEIPYVAFSKDGKAIASGKFCLGVLHTHKKFQDLPSSSWCYKYVSELSDAKVIDGFQDGTFRPDATVNYGQALKLIMLAAGYPAQKPTNDNVFSGYLVKAKADGLISGNVDLKKPISRQAVAQIAAKALKLDTSRLSSVKPFTDTSDPYVQALNAAGIVEGYFNNGTSTFKPNNTLTRGHISAIVWRMNQLKK